MSNDDDDETKGENGMQWNHKILVDLFLMLIVAIAISANFQGCSKDDTDLWSPHQLLKRIIEHYPRQGGSEQCEQAATYIWEMMRVIGLDNIRYEEFNFPYFEVRNSVFTTDIYIDFNYSVLSYCGSGDIETELVYVGTATDNELENMDINGKIALVDRHLMFHRSAQYRNIIEHGGAGMVYISSTPNNAIQVGSVRDGYEGYDDNIPAISIGAQDGQMLKEELAAGSLNAHLLVDARLTKAKSSNVIAQLTGTTYPDKYMLWIAHYDSWFVGALDNGSGVATMLKAAEKLHDSKAYKYTNIFIASSGEETGLYGAYHFIKTHPEIIDNLVLAVSFDMVAYQPNNDESVLAVPNNDALRDLLEQLVLVEHYNLLVEPQTVCDFYGGTLANDLQGFFWSNKMGIMMAAGSPYYHTKLDVFETIDHAYFDQVAKLWMDFTVDVQDLSPESLVGNQVHIITLDYPAELPVDTPLEGTATIIDPATNQPVTDAEVTWVVFENDFWPVRRGTAQHQGDGVYSFHICKDFIANPELSHYIQVRSKSGNIISESYGSFTVIPK